MGSFSSFKISEASLVASTSFWLGGVAPGVTGPWTMVPSARSKATRGLPPIPGLEDNTASSLCRVERSTAASLCRAERSTAASGLPCGRKKGALEMPTEDGVRPCSGPINLRGAPIDWP